MAEQLGEQGIALYVIDVRAERDENLALSLPRLARESITSPGSLELEIDVLNRGAARTVNLDLELEQPDASRPSYRDGEVIVPDRTWSRTASVDLPEAGSATVSLAIPDLPLGVHQGRVRLRPSDALSFDNTRYLTIEVRQPWRCLVFAAPETRSSVLIEAVTPTAERLAGRSVFAFETATYTEFGKYRLEDFEAVFLLDPGPMDPASWELLSDYVRGGGALSLFLGPSAEVVDTAGLGFREVHPSFVSPESRLVLPGKPTFVWNSPGSGVLLSPRDYAHPLLRPLRGFETSVPWTEFPVNQHWGWEFPADDSDGSAAEGDDDVDRREPPGPAQVVIGYSDGTPAVLQADVEEGTVWVWTTPIGESVGASSPDRWNQLTVGDCWPYFLLMNQLSATMVTADTSRLNLLVGETAEMTWRGDGAPEALTFYSPNGGEPERLRGDHGLWRVRFTETPGAYRFKGGSDEIRTLGFAVNPAESDSDLNALPEAWWEEAFPDASVQLAQAVDELRRQQGTARQGRDFFETLLMWLPVLMAVEFLFASLSQQRPGTGTTRGGGGGDTNMTQWSLSPVTSVVVILGVCTVLAGLLVITARQHWIPTPRRRVLIAFRAMAVLLLATMMLRPGCIQTVSQPQRATIAVTVDVSRSMQLPHVAGGESRWSDCVRCSRRPARNGKSSRTSSISRCLNSIASCDRLSTTMASSRFPTCPRVGKPIRASHSTHSPSSYEATASRPSFSREMVYKTSSFRRSKCPARFARSSSCKPRC
ncbi:MAG: hypothetical protein R3B96_00535 [Pirellulaceae bacterium]